MNATVPSLRDDEMIRKLKDGRYRLYSTKIDPKTGKRRNLGTFKTRAEAEKARARGSVLQAPTSHEIHSTIDRLISRSRALFPGASDFSACGIKTSSEGTRILIGFEATVTSFEEVGSVGGCDGSIS
jgi:hypothetical protein